MDREGSSEVEVGVGVESGMQLKARQTTGVVMGVGELELRDAKVDPITGYDYYFVDAFTVTNIIISILMYTNIPC
mgnify:CR=1 FL=1